MKPKVAVSEDLQKHPELQLTEEVLARGSVLYRRQCLHCHGLVGDGNGPTGQFLNPKPRDFRQKLFKFRSTAKPAGKGEYNFLVTDIAPSREDLKKTLRNGIPTASMPSFNLLPEADLDALVSYVIHLSLRGQVEQRVARNLLSGVYIEEEQPDRLTQMRAADWLNEARSVYQPPEPAKPWTQLHEEAKKTKWAKGRRLFQVGQCIGCHGKDGRASLLDPDVRTNAERRNAWGDLNPPRDLTLGWFRGGSRPIDIFYRIKLGISGSGMTPAAAELTDQDIWVLVDYVLSLPQQQ
jgi:mono/diheme cytochrome c family protein